MMDCCQRATLFTEGDLNRLLPEAGLFSACCVRTILGTVHYRDARSRPWLLIRETQLGVVNSVKVRHVQKIMYRYAYRK